MSYKIKTKLPIPLRKSNRAKSQFLLDFAGLPVGDCMIDLTKNQYQRCRVYAHRYNYKIIGRRIDFDKQLYAIWRVA